MWKRSESLTQKEKKALYDKRDLNTTISEKKEEFNIKNSETKRKTVLL